MIILFIPSALLLFHESSSMAPPIRAPFVQKIEGGYLGSRWARPMLCSRSFPHKIVDVTDDGNCPKPMGKEKPEKMVDVTLWKKNPTKGLTEVKLCSRSCRVRAEKNGFLSFGRERTEWKEIRPLLDYECRALPIRTSDDTSDIFPSAPEYGGRFWEPRTWYQTEACRNSAYMTMAAMSSGTVEIKGMDATGCSPVVGSCVTRMNVTMVWVPQTITTDEFIPVLEAKAVLGADGFVFIRSPFVIAFDQVHDCKKVSHLQLPWHGISLKSGIYQVCSTRQGMHVTISGERDYDEAEMSYAKSTAAVDRESHYQFTDSLAQLISRRKIGDPELQAIAEKIAKEEGYDNWKDLKARKKREAYQADLTALLQAKLIELGDGVGDYVSAAVSELCLRDNQLLRVLASRSPGAGDDPMFVRELTGDWYTTGHSIGRYIIVQTCVPIRNFTVIPDIPGSCTAEARLRVGHLGETTDTYMNMITHIITATPTPIPCGETTKLFGQTDRGPVLVDKVVGSLVQMIPERSVFMTEVSQARRDQFRVLVEPPMNSIAMGVLLSDMENQITRPEIGLRNFHRKLTDVGQPLPQAADEEITKVLEKAQGFSIFELFFGSFDAWKCMAIFSFVFGALGNVVEWLLPNSWGEAIKRKCSLTSIIWDFMCWIIIDRVIKALKERQLIGGPRQASAPTELPLSATYAPLPTNPDMPRGLNLTPGTGY